MPVKVSRYRFTEICHRNQFIERCNEMTSKSTPVLEAALNFNARGWTVVPVCPSLKGCGGPHCDDKLRGKHPLINNFTRLTHISPVTLGKWFADRPDAGVGIVTGKHSGLVTVDIDGADGEESLKKLEQQYGPLPDTLTVTTGRDGGGRHLYFRHPGGKVASPRGIVPGIDIRADGSFVVAPPSIHRSGAQYHWVDDKAELADAPLWLIQLANGSKTKQTSAKQVPAAPSAQSAPADGLRICKGQRNDWLFKRGCSLRGQGQQHSEIETALVELNEQYCDPPLPETKVQLIAASVCLQYQPGNAKPRSHAQRREENPLWYWMLDTGKYRAETHAMNDQQLGWHISLSVEAWDCQGVIDGNPDKLWRTARASSKEVFEQNCADVLEMFDAANDTDGRPILIHRRINKQWAEKNQIHEQRELASAKGVLARKLKAEAEALEVLS